MSLEHSIGILDDLLARARKAGAESCDALMVEGASLGIAERLGQPEKLERAEGRDLGLRVLVGKRQAIVSSTDFRPSALTELVERALAMARAVPEDPFCGIAEPGQLATTLPALDTLDAVEPATATLVEHAKRAEE